MVDTASYVPRTIGVNGIPIDGNNKRNYVTQKFFYYLVLGDTTKIDNQIAD